MDINDDLYNNLSLIWEYSKTKYKCLLMFVTGSSVLKYINNKHDIDIAMIFPDEIRFGEVRSDEYIKELSIEIFNKYNAVLLFRNTYIIENLSSNKIWGYQYLYVKNNILFGEYNLPEYNLFNNKKEYINHASSVIKIYNVNENILSNFKFLYHILTVMYMFQNNSYDLTEEQINNINIIHDCQDKDKILELYSEIKKWIIKEMEEVADDNT